MRRADFDASAPARTEARHDGLSMFLVEKPRGDDAEPFTLQGLSGSEIESAELSRHEGNSNWCSTMSRFVPAAALLGGGVRAEAFAN